MDISYILNQLGEERGKYFHSVAPPIIQSSNFCCNTVDDLRSAILNEEGYHLYTRGNNPRSYNREYNYSYVPINLAEYPAIGHDRRCDNLETKGAWGLFTETRAIGADCKFVEEQMQIATNPFLNPVIRMSAGILGVGLGFFALPKHYSN